MDNTPLPSFQPTIQMVSKEIPQTVMTTVNLLQLLTTSEISTMVQEAVTSITRKFITSALRMLIKILISELNNLRVINMKSLMSNLAKRAPMMLRTSTLTMVQFLDSIKTELINQSNSLIPRMTYTLTSITRVTLYTVQSILSNNSQLRGTWLHPKQSTTQRVLSPPCQVQSSQ